MAQGARSCVLDGISYKLSVRALPPDDDYLPMVVVVLEAELAGPRDADLEHPAVVVAEWRERVGASTDSDLLEQAYTSICISHRWVAVILQLADPIIR